MDISLLLEEYKPVEATEEDDTEEVEEELDSELTGLPDMTYSEKK